MPITVATAPGTVKVVSIENEQDNSGVPIFYTNQIFYNNPTEAIALCRISLYFYIPSTSSGDPLIATFKAIDSVGNTQIVSVASTNVGQARIASGIVAVAGGNSITFTTSFAGSGTIIPSYGFRSTIESL